MDAEIPSVPVSAPMVVAIAPAQEAPKSDELPHDDDSVPFIEVGGPRAIVTLPKIVPSAITDTKQVELSPMPAAPSAESGHAGVLYLPVSFQAVPFSLPRPSGRPPVVASDTVTFHHPEHAVSGQYRTLWTDLIATCQRGQPRVLLFTSVLPAAGVTTVVLNIAITAARDPESRVLLVDSDRRVPAVAERLGLASSPGMFDWLDKPFPLGLALQESVLKNLHVLPAGAALTGNRAPHSERLVLLADQVRQRFDWVLVDAGTWGEPAALAWARRCDAAFLVIRRADSDTIEVGRAHEEIARQGGPLKGYILTGG